MILKWVLLQNGELDKKEKYYVKFYKNTDQAKTEFITNRIYRKLGIKAPDSEIVELDGRIAIASKGIEEAEACNQEELQQNLQQKVEEQSALAAGKETSVNISKVQRLETIGRRIEKEWLTTSPYSRKNLSIKVGLMPLLGAWDVVKSNLQATPAQENDKAYRNFVNLIRAQLARGMGDVGNLSEYEQAAVVGGIPTLMDTKETGIKKLQKIFRLVQDIRNARNRGNMLIGQNKYAPMNNDQQQGEFKQDNTYLWEE